MHISSPDNSLIKHLCRLKDGSAYRGETFLVEGRKMVAEAISRLPVKVVVVSDESLMPEGVKGCVVTKTLMRKTSSQANPEGIVAEVEYAPERKLGNEQYVLVLDGLQDPGNVGTLIRTAVALGWEAVVLVGDCCDPFGPKALAAGKGATFRIPVVEMRVEELGGINLPLVAADMGGKPFKKIGPCALILGNEGQGLSEEIRALGPQIVSIPFVGDMESLNVAAAGAILLHGLK